jgi:hypothetical protein
MDDDSEYSQLINEYNNTLNESCWIEAYGKYIEYTVDFIKEIRNKWKPRDTILGSNRDIAHDFWTELLENKVVPFNINTDIVRFVWREALKASTEAKGGLVEHISLEDNITLLDKELETPSKVNDAQKVLDSIFRYINELSGNRKVICKLHFLYFQDFQRIAKVLDLSTSRVSHIVSEERFNILMRINK